VKFPSSYDQNDNFRHLNWRISPCWYLSETMSFSLEIVHTLYPQIPIDHEPPSQGHTNIP
jgi:hypothetical protein